MNLKFATGVLLLCAMSVLWPQPPAVWLPFDAEATEDRSGKATPVEVVGASAGKGGVGQALVLNGAGEIILRPGARLDLSRGFTFSAWVRFDKLGTATTIASREGEFLLRLDREEDGGTISFFIHMDGSLNPRLYGPRPPVGRWVRLTAWWDQREMHLLVDQQHFRQRRKGVFVPTGNPLVLGGKLKSGFGAGLVGALDEVKIYERVLTEDELFPDRPGLDIKWFMADEAVARAQRVVTLFATLTNGWEGVRDVTATLSLPPSLKLLGTNAFLIPHFPSGFETNLFFQVRSEQAQAAVCTLAVRAASGVSLTRNYTLQITPPVAISKVSAVPTPQPVTSDLLIGFQNCPLWDVDHAPKMWGNVARDPRRVPLLGAYAEENPEVKDWETKWMVEHGAQFMFYCWYRTNGGFPPTSQASIEFGNSIHPGFLKSRHASFAKFAIMWVNNPQKGGIYEVRSESEFLDDVVPFWIREYLTKPTYLTVDGRPVIGIFDPENFAKNLGGIPQTASAIKALRAQVRRAGFPDVLLMGHARMPSPKLHQPLKDMGFDCAFSYNWVVPGNPEPEYAVAKQVAYWKQTKALAILPHIVTLSVGWTGWGDEGPSIWRLPPAAFKTLCQEAKAFVAALPEGDLGKRMLLIDNWNEYGEGHWIAPTRDYGFGHLDALRDVFTSKPGPHIDLIPQDVGLGPYDAHYPYLRRSAPDPKERK